MTNPTYRLPTDRKQRIRRIITDTHRYDVPVDVRDGKEAYCWYCGRMRETFSYRLASWVRREDEVALERCSMCCLECGAGIGTVCLRPVDAAEDVCETYIMEDVALPNAAQRVDEMMQQISASLAAASIAPMVLDVGGVLQIKPSQVIGRRLAVLGSSGKGKSMTVRVFCEGMLKFVPMTIFDPHGEFSTLGELFPMLHVGRGIGVDAEVGAAQAAALGRMALEKGVSVVVNMLLMKDDEREAFVFNYCNAMWEANLERRTPYIIVLEEADEFIKQGGKETESFALLKQFFKAGRKFGFGVVLSSQRAAMVDKTMLAQCDMLILHGVNIYNDLAAYQTVLPYPMKDVKEKFLTMDAGKALVRWKSADGLRHDDVQICLSQTTHAGDTPMGGEVAKPLQRVDKALIDELIATLNATEAYAPKDGAAQLRKEVIRLRAELERVTAERDEARARVAELEGEQARREVAAEATSALREAWQQTAPTGGLLSHADQLKADQQARQVKLQQDAWNRTRNAVNALEARNIVLLYEAIVAASTVEWGQVKAVSTAEVAERHMLASVTPGVLVEMQMLVAIAGRRGWYAFNPKVYFEKFFNLLDQGILFQELSNTVIARMDKRGAA